MAKRFFTKEELDNIIKDYDNGNGLRPFELAKKYDRNPSSISNKLKDLGLYKYTTYRFTAEDIQFLKDYYPYGDWDFIMKHFPNSTKQSIMTKASKLGIKMINEHTWTEDEVNVIKKYYTTDIRKVESLLSNRTPDTIRCKAQKLGIKNREFWSDEENELLTKIYSNYK